MGESQESFLSQVKSLTSSSKSRTSIIILSVGTFLILIGVFLNNKLNSSNSSVEVLDTPSTDNNATSTPSGKLTIDISGEVLKPGVYDLPFGSRIEGALEIAGGLTENADKNWVDKNINRASKLVDGQKIFIPSNKQSEVLSASNSSENSSVAQSLSATSSNLLNINGASLGELDNLPGIGPVYAQKIIDNRPYSNIEELVSKKVLSSSLYNKIKDQLSVY